MKENMLKNFEVYLDNFFKETGYSQEVLDNLNKNGGEALNILLLDLKLYVAGIAQGKNDYNDKDFEKMFVDALNLISTCSVVKLLSELNKKEEENVE